MINFIASLSRSSKRLILLGLDGVLFPISLYIAFALRYGNLNPAWAIKTSLLLFPMVTAIGLILAVVLGLSRVKLSTMDGRSILRIGLCAIILTLSTIFISYAFQLGAPRSVPIIFGATFLVLATGTRVFGQYILTTIFNNSADQKRVLIYGAGSAGGQLAGALTRTPEVRPICFVDDNPSLRGLIVSGLPVFAAKDIEKVIKDKRIDRIVLAVPSVSDRRRKELVKKLTPLHCEVLALPSILDLIADQGLVESLKPVSLDDLLGRDKVDLHLPEVARTYAGKSVMVTGAGGSIGSELCRQLMTCDVKRIVFFDHSEFALYAIEMDLASIAKKRNIELVPILGSVTDTVIVSAALSKHEVNVVLHAAAYKHVPLVEANEVSGLRNNVLGTHIVAKAAKDAKIERFILVSTDKAVRPTNVMGASKRLAELVVQDLASRSETTLFSMVRFGNVLGSSGSVIPLFQKQLERGGPLTVTHRDVTRYFMTIPEAARLVLLAGSYARGGDVFVLDMGEPVTIWDLARVMIELSGLTVRDESNPDGDIEIDITGLRPGEKLYEELLIGKDTLPTPHDKILRAAESKLPKTAIATIIKELTIAAKNNDSGRGRAVVKKYVEGYNCPD